MKCVYTLPFTRAGQDDSNAIERRDMGTNRIRITGQGRRSGTNGGRQPMVCRGGSLERPNVLSVARFAEGIRSMAYGVHALFTVASQRCVGMRGARRVRRDGDQTCVDRLNRHACAPAFGWCSKKSGPQAIGRSRGRLTTNCIWPSMTPGGLCE